VLFGLIAKLLEILEVNIRKKSDTWGNILQLMTVGTSKVSSLGE